MLPIKACISEDTQKSLVKGAAQLLEPFGIGASLLSDKLAYYRLECLINIVNKAIILCEENNIDPKPISKKFLSRFIEESSYENNNTLQDMWANLLISEMLEKEVSVRYINVLKEISVEEATFLKTVYLIALKENFDCEEEFFKQSDAKPDMDLSAKISSIWGKKGMLIITSTGKSEFALERKYTAEDPPILFHLQQHGLIKVLSYAQFYPSKAKDMYTCISITPFGFKFVESCESENSK